MSEEILVILELHITNENKTMCETFTIRTALTTVTGANVNKNC